jgi:hypothetical protein
MLKLDTAERIKGDTGSTPLRPVGRGVRPVGAARLRGHGVAAGARPLL